MSSANQYPVDPAAYPYYLGGEYPPYRGYIINRFLGAMTNNGGITVTDMMKLQTENYNVFAEMARPIFLKNINEGMLDATEKKYLDIFKNWDLNNEVDAIAPTVFSVLWNSFDSVVFNDEFKNLLILYCIYNGKILSIFGLVPSPSKPILIR